MTGSKNIMKLSGGGWKVFVDAPCTNALSKSSGTDFDAVI